MDFRTRQSGGGIVEPGKDSWRLWIPAGSDREYRLAQIDDYAGLRRSRYPWQPPLTLSLRARVSNGRIAGTWGFGPWNDPFGLSIGGGSELLRLPALPQSAWFFGASVRSYLSFRDDMPANGFFAQALRSGRAGGSLVGAAAALPFAPRASRRMLARLVEEDAKQVRLQPETWHRYTIEWRRDGTAFRVDDALILQSQTAPRSPLGLVMWVDNQFASFRPDQWPRWGLEASNEAAWLEIEGIRISGSGA